MLYQILALVFSLLLCIQAVALPHAAVTGPCKRTTHLNKLAVAPVKRDAPLGLFKPLHEVTEPGVPIDGQYLVMLNKDSIVDTIVSSLPSEIRDNVKRRYSSVKGFAGKFTDAQLAIIRALPAVRYVDHDQKVFIEDTQQGAPFNLAITSEQQTLAQQDQNTYNWAARAGRMVTRHFIIDTGIDASHPELAGSVEKIANFVQGEAHEDYYGHGTHVAGTVNSATWGVLKDSILGDVKVLNAQGEGDFSTVIAGIDYVADNYGNTDPNVGCVINMSLAGGYSQAVNDAVEHAYEQSCVVVVAAGNYGASSYSGGECGGGGIYQPSIGACQLSPASAQNAITVGAVDSTYNVAYFSSEDGCVDMHAPGVDVTSTFLGGATATLSGTSMAAPHVAGLAGYYIYIFGSKVPNDVWLRVLDYSDKDIIQGDLRGAPNRLGNNGWSDF